MGDTVAEWLPLPPHSMKVAALIPMFSWGLSAWSLHALPVSAWVLFGFSGFVQQSNNLHVR